jgi:hypothetical protein
LIFYLVVDCPSVGTEEFLPTDPDVEALVSFEGTQPDLTLVQQLSPFRFIRGLHGVDGGVVEL